MKVSMRVGISPKILNRMKPGDVKINPSQSSANFSEVSGRMLGKLEQQ